MCSWGFYKWSKNDGEERESATEKVLVNKKGLKEEQYFIKNGNYLLEKQIRICNLNYNPIKIFSKEELKKATKNYSQNQIFHVEGPYDLYKGTYEGTSVLVKKFKKNLISVENNISEIVIASQMSSHKNVLRLLGCCLQTKSPILVYEFAGKGALSNHILVDSKGQSSSGLSWDQKLRIAIEIADVVTYVHIAKSRPIIHRGIKSYNIFLDDNSVPKLPGFTFSLPIPLGETHVEAPVVGTWGYIDPEAVTSGRFTVKSDVYGFGAILIEIVTGKFFMDILKQEENSDHSWALFHYHNNISTFVEKYLKGGSVLREGNRDQLMACGEIALRCLRENPEERPTMKEVAVELRQVRKQQPSYLCNGQEERTWQQV